MDGDFDSIIDEALKKKKTKRLEHDVSFDNVLMKKH
jgi:hypothetical protein